MSRKATTKEIESTVSQSGNGATCVRPKAMDW